MVGPRVLPRLRLTSSSSWAFRHGAPRKQRRRLGDEADPLVLAGPVRAGAVDGDPTGRRLVEAGDDPEQRGLAAAARPEHGDDLARRDLEVDPGEGLRRVERLAHAAELDAADTARERYRLSLRS